MHSSTFLLSNPASRRIFFIKAFHPNFASPNFHVHTVLEVADLDKIKTGREKLLNADGRRSASKTFAYKAEQRAVNRALKSSAIR